MLPVSAIIELPPFRPSVMVLLTEYITKTGINNFQQGLAGMQLTKYCVHVNVYPVTIHVDLSGGQ